MKNKITIEEEINRALEYWDVNHMTSLLEDLVEIYHLYNVDQSNDWVIDQVGEENHVTIRLIRTVYLISRLSENHAGAIAGFKVKFPKLWKRIEKSGDELSC